MLASDLSYPFVIRTVRLIACFIPASGRCHRTAPLKKCRKHYVKLYASCLLRNVLVSKTLADELVLGADGALLYYCSQEH